MKTNQTPSEVEEKIDEILCVAFEAGYYSSNNHKDGMYGETKFKECKQQLAALIEQAKVEQSFKVIQSLVKAGAISDASAAGALAFYTTKESEVNNE